VVTAPRILIVEDDPKTSASIEMYLRHEGYRTELARSGDEGLSRAREHKPDLVILDLMLPGLNGLEVCRALRAVSKLPRPLSRNSCICCSISTALLTLLLAVAKWLCQKRVIFSWSGRCVSSMRLNHQNLADSIFLGSPRSAVSGASNWMRVEPSPTASIASPTPCSSFVSS